MNINTSSNFNEISEIDYKQQLMEQEAHNEKQIKDLQDQVKHLKTKNEILKKDSKQ